MVSHKNFRLLTPVAYWFIINPTPPPKKKGSCRFKLLFYVISNVCDKAETSLSFQVSSVKMTKHQESLLQVSFLGSSDKTHTSTFQTDHYQICSWLKSPKSERITGLSPLKE